MLLGCLLIDDGMCAAYILYKRPVYICTMCKLIHLYKQCQQCVVYS